MTEAEWLACEEPEDLMAALRRRTSLRFRRLVAVACCRTVWRQLVDERSRNGLGIAEGFIERTVTRLTLDGAWRAAYAAFESFQGESFGSVASHAAEAVYAALLACHSQKEVRVEDDPLDRSVVSAMNILAGRKGGMLLLCKLVRDIAGNPFHPVSLTARFRASAVITLAQAA
ncbi:MAG: hypothetical protein K2W96_07855 [Gemmataceae bacterium]|nr:hypothetical protein [Gemmataceae bacterium]